MSHITSHSLGELNLKKNGSKSTGSANGTSTTKPQVTQEDIFSKRLAYLRAVVCASLIAATVICGYGSYALLQNVESRAEKNQYESIVVQLQTSSYTSLYAKILALKSLGANLGLQCPNTEIWPNCTMPWKSFLNISDPIIDMAILRTIAFAPIITPAQVAPLEEHVYNFYENDGFGGLGIRPFGKGIYSRDCSSCDAYHDVEGNKEGQHGILTPVVQIGNLESNRPAVMFNLYSQEYRINAIDFMINCVAAGGRDEECTAITDIIHLVQDPIFRPAVLIIHPVNPVNNPSDLVGLVYTVHNWDSILSNAIPNYVTGVDAILHSNEKAYTFRIDNGQAIFVGNGDFHESDYDDTGRYFDFNLFAGSVTYSITLYSTSEYSNQFRTDGPLIACIISVSIILLTSMIFFIYDYFMNRQALRNELVIHTKRMFVRFISHEIRTPMNTVHVGLKLLNAEMRGMMSKKKMISMEALNHQLLDWVDLVEEIEESSDTAIVVLNDLINYDKISVGGLQIEVRMLSLWEVVSQSVKPFLVQARQKNITLKLDMEIRRPEELVSKERREQLRRLVVNADDIKITQVIRNMVSNALKFTPTDGTVTVTMFWDEKGLPRYVSDMIEDHNPAPATGTPRTPDCMPSSSIETNEVIPPHPPSSSSSTPHGSSVHSVTNHTNVHSNSVHDNSVHSNHGGGVSTTKQLSVEEAPSDPSLNDDRRFPRAGCITVLVQDSGAGLTAEELKNLFKEGVQFRANQLQAGGGSGLGLWISKGVVEMHNGKLSATSEGENKGSAFRMELPVYSVPPSSALVWEDNETISGKAKGNHQDELATLVNIVESANDSTKISKQLNILVVDDVSSTRRVVCRLLNHGGHICFEAIDGQDCIEKWDKLTSEGIVFDLILMDFEMPRLNGPSATRILRDQGCSVPIVGVSGNVLSTDKTFFCDHGANEVLAKPLRINELQRITQNYCLFPATSLPVLGKEESKDALNQKDKEDRITNSSTANDTSTAITPNTLQATLATTASKAESHAESEEKDSNNNDEDDLQISIMEEGNASREDAVKTV